MFAKAPRSAALLLASALSVASGCSVDGDLVDAQRADILEGDFAVGYAEAVHVNMMGGELPNQRCSGTLIAPRVVLTAGHCVDGYTAWGVYAPFAGEQGTLATRAEVLDWDTGLTFDYDAHDVAVVLLDEDIVIDHYPVLAAEPVDDGTEAIIVGRTTQGYISPDWLFASEPTRIYQQKPQSSLDHARYYFAESMVEKGDSGGPVFAVDPTWEEGSPRTVTAVVSTLHFLTRVELVRDWVQGYLPPE